MRYGIVKSDDYDLLPSFLTYTIHSFHYPAAWRNEILPYCAKSPANVFTTLSGSSSMAITHFRLSSRRACRRLMRWNDVKGWWKQGRGLTAMIGKDNAENETFVANMSPGMCGDDATSDWASIYFISRWPSGCDALRSTSDNTAVRHEPPDGAQCLTFYNAAVLRKRLGCVVASS